MIKHAMSAFMAMMLFMLSNLALADNNDHLQSQIDDNRNAAQAARQLSEQVNSKAYQNGADIQDMARCNGEWGNMSVCQGGGSGGGIDTDNFVTKDVFNNKVTQFVNGQNRQNTNINNNTSAISKETNNREEGDNRTLADANKHSDMNDKKTLTSANTYTDNSLTTFKQQQSVVDNKQDVAIDNNTAAIKQTNIKVANNSKAIDQEISDRKEGDKATLESANKHSDEKDKDTLYSANTYTDTAVSDLYSYQSGIDNRQDRAINNLNNRVGILEGRVGVVEQKVFSLEDAVKNLKGMVAAQMAASSIVMPRGSNGNNTIGVGIGHYDGYNGLSFGYVHDNGQGLAVKMVASGTDADNWSTLSYAASANFSF